MKIVGFKKNIVWNISLLITMGFFTFPHFVSAATLLKPPTNLGLVAYWSFNEGTSTIAHDYSGKGNNGVLTNFSSPASSISGWANGKRGYGLNFDSSDDMVRVASSSSLSNLSASTYSVWIYPRSEGRNSRGGIFNKVSTAGSSNGGQEFEFGNAGLDGVDRTNALAFFVPYSGTSLLRITSDNSIKMGKWQHVVLTWDGSTSASNVHIYIDGVEASYQKSQDAVGTRNDDTNHGLSIGVGQYVITQNPFDGVMDEFRIYNRVLSSSEIATLYRTGNISSLPNTNKGLVAYWPMNEGTSTSVGDVSGKGNHMVKNSLMNWVSGKFGKALSFVNSSGMQADSVAGTIATGDVTFTAWIKFDQPYTAASTEGIITRLGDSPSTNDVVLQLGTFSPAANDGKLHFSVGNSSQLIETSSSKSSWDANTWYFVAGTHSGTDGEIIYINGVQDGTHAVVTRGSTKATHFAVGKNTDTAANYLIGASLDDVRVYNRALSSDEIKYLYQNSKLYVINSGQNNRMTNGLVGLWSFNGSDIDWSKNIVYDRSGSNNNGTTTGMGTTTSPVAGKVGQALYFNGNNNLISVPDSPSVSVTGPITISFWFKTSTTAGGSRLFWKRSGANNNSYDVLVSGAGALTLNIDTGGSVGATTPGSYMDNEWHHFAGTWDQSNIIVYMDGVSVASTPQTGSMSDTVDPLTIGNKNDGSAPYTGLLDEVRLYNRALSSVEVKQLYHMGK